MGSEIQPGVIRAQEREIQRTRATYLLIKKIIYPPKKLLFGVFIWKSFL
jgi:hypothetical protein